MVTKTKGLNTRSGYLGVIRLGVKTKMAEDPIDKAKDAYKKQEGDKPKRSLVFVGREFVGYDSEQRAIVIGEEIVPLMNAEPDSELVRKAEVIGWPTTRVVQDIDTGKTWEEPESPDKIAFGARQYDEAAEQIRKDPVNQFNNGVIALAFLVRRAKDRVVKYIKGE